MSSHVETIQQAVKPHDRYQVEIKLDYEISDDAQTRYTVETYIFAPQSLDVSAETYTKKQFYRDVKNYIRLKTPTMLLRDFPHSKTSPLVVLKEIATTPNWINDTLLQDRLQVNFKLLATMLNSAIREHLAHINTRVEEVEPHGKVHLVVDTLVEEFLTETEMISRCYRDLFAIFNLPHVDNRVLNGYRFTDESISILVEEGLIDLFQIVESYSKKSLRSDFQSRIAEQVKLETKHRRQHGYPSLLTADENNETYLYRTSVLKKYADSILFLTDDVSQDGRQLTHLSNAAAAGIAMIFATLITFYFQSQYGGFTFPLFTALVIGYMFKDRIKEAARDLFSRHIQSFLYDRRIVIRTQDGVKLGHLKEKVDFISESEVPRLVLKARNRNQFSKLDNDGRGENIIRHTKQIVLYTSAFKKIFGDTIQITGVNDILRYNIRTYLDKMGEPEQERYYFEDETLHPITCHKVYHLNVVSRYKTVQPEKAKTHRRIRLILNRTGILRMETVS